MANRYLEKKIVKWTVDVSANVAAYVTGGLGGPFAAAAISAAADTITITNHGFQTGDFVGLYLLASTGVAPGAPVVGTGYYIIYVDKDTVSLATSLANAKAGTVVALTAGSAVDCYLVPGITGAVKSTENSDCAVIPSGAIVTDSWYEVITTFQSDDGAVGGGNADDATIALHIVSANDLVSAVAINAADPGVFDDGIRGTLAGSPTLGVDASHDTAVEFAALKAASFIQTTADSPITMTVANTAYLHAGKMDIYVEYVN
jgi:hypothetical protein